MGAYGVGLEGVIAKWTSGRTEGTLNQIAANGRNEPKPDWLHLLPVANVEFSQVQSGR